MPTAAAAPAWSSRAPTRNLRAKVQIKDLIIGAELANLSKERDDYLKKQAEAQFPAREDELVEAVRTVLARHNVNWG